MSDRELWIASIKAKVLENCELNSDGSEFQFVECLFLASNAQQIIDEINKNLPIMRLELVEVIKCCVYQPGDWHDEHDPLVAELIQEAADEVQAHGKLQFGPFTSSNYLL